MVTYPVDWEKLCIADCADIFQGGTPSTTNPKYWNGSIVWLTPGEITKNKGMFIGDSERKITLDGVNNSSAVLLPEGTILLCTRATIGVLAIATRELTTNQGFKNLFCKPNTNNNYLAYLLLTMKGELVLRAIGTTFLEISKKELSKIKVCVPLFPEQQAIASVLSDIDEHIDNLTELIEKKKAIRDGALEDSINGKTRVDGFDGEWDEKSLKDLGDVLTGLTYSPDDIRPFGKLVIRSSNVQDDRLVFENNVFVDRSCVNSEDVKKGDIIICVRNGSASLIGKSAYAISDLDATFGAFMSNFRCQDIRSSGFVYYFTKSNEFKNFVRQILGATINQITKTDLKRVVLKIPIDIEEQQTIASILTAMDEEIESLEAEKVKMMGIREGAMDDLLTGRVRLKI